MSMFNTLRHRRLMWIHVVISVWLSVFSSYALAMQARMQVDMAFQAAAVQEIPCPDHAAPYHSESNTHDCPICHAVSSGWVQTSLCTLVQEAMLNTAPNGRLFQPVEYLQIPSTPPPNV
jgi:hypothetical protein